MIAHGKHILITGGWIDPEGSKGTGNWTLEIVSGAKLLRLLPDLVAAQNDKKEPEIRKMYTNDFKLNTKSIAGVTIKYGVPNINDRIRIDDKFEWVVLEIDENQRCLGCARYDYEPEPEI